MSNGNNNIDTSEEQASLQQIEFDLGGYTSNRHNSRTLIIVPVLSGAYAINHFLQVRAQWGVVSCNQKSNTSSTRTANLGNPFLSFIWSPEIFTGITSQISAGFTIPIAHLPNNASTRNERDAYAFASALKGLKSMWLWSPDRFAFAVPLTLQWRASLFAIINLDTSAAVMLPTKQSSNNRTDAIFEFGAEIKTQSPLSLGFRIQTVTIITLPTDRLQLSVSSFLEHEREFVTARIELSMPVGDPLAVFNYWFANLTTTFRF
ncbi:MAG: hypothetical protein JW841_16535 [Deltaproteobacteria bacterium]|nr:hypothetical protein [Deltaproteobacteria bacterium]